MFRKLLLIAAATLMLASVSSVAYADPVTLAQGQSVTFNYQTSQTGVNGTATFTLTGNVLEITYTNTSTSAACTGNNCSLTGIGFNTSPNLTITSSSFSGSESNFWSFGTNGGGLGGFELRVSGSNGVNHALNTNETQTAQLTFSVPGGGTPAFITIDLTQAHFQSMPITGNSEKPTGAPIPEPATMMLLGTGLAGVAAKMRKRRNAVKE